VLRKLGVVLHKTPNGYIVVRMEERERLPPLNTPVYDRSARRVGVLLDIIGPVESPYAVVKPDRRDIEVGGGEELYYRRPMPRRGQRQRGRPGPRRGRPPRGRGRKR
jgi:RNA-binding protein